MSDWDDDDFEPEVDGLAPPTVVQDMVPEADVPKPQPAKPKPKYLQKEGGSAFKLEDLNRELTPKEREDIQRRSDLTFARELFGGGEEDDDHNSWEKIMTKDEFEMWGDKAGKFFATRHLAGHYGDFLGKILANLAAPLEAVEIRKMSNLLKQIADSKATEEKEKKTGGAAKPGKGKAKPSLKATGAKAGGKTGGGGGSMYDDYEGGGASSKYDDYDDFM